MITDEEKMKIERARVSDLLAEAIQSLEAENGDIRFFNAAFLVAAIQLHAEIEGPETIARALSKVGVRELTRSGTVTTC
ncbi:hypothetical protein [Oceaniglobus ichthyenteri]|uniref:hypothetical protein n=1 Tax=Oceaniglobus ichthyenteri TaxID=2136177 RepID=UPI000D3A2BF7|nr:hypothetical protein [Oceaniglobus ichthyenteri]